MADFDIPADLLDLQRSWYRVDARCEKIASSLPRAVDVVAGVAEPSSEQQAELAAARAERLRVTEALQDHDWWTTMDDRLAAKAALRDAARS